MHRSLQIQLLGWLTALAVLGAALKPSFETGPTFGGSPTDTVLFATAFVVGAMMMFVRERLDPRREGLLLGRLLGASVAWGVVPLRRLPSLAPHVPPRLTTPVLVAAAVVPTGLLVLEAALALHAHRQKNRVRRRDP